MLSLKETFQPEQIRDSHLRELLELRRLQLGSLEGMILVEPGDSMPDLETVMGLKFLLWDDDPDAWAFEIL